VGVWVHVDVILQPHLWRASQMYLKQLQGHPCCALQQSQDKINKYQPHSHTHASGLASSKAVPGVCSTPC
jgi:hypothetical protein